jgi:carbonic anhydrase
VNRLIPIDSASDVPETLRGTPFELMLEYHDLGRPFDTYTQAEMLIGMCMDSRKHLRIPDNFAFIIRSGGANLRIAEFKVSYAIAIGGAKAIALIGHTHCGMVNLEERRQAFIEGLVARAGWEEERAEEHFNHFSQIFEIGNEVDFVMSEAKRLRLRYPRVPVAPFIYRLEDNRIYALREG